MLACEMMLHRNCKMQLLERNYDILDSAYAYCYRLLSPLQCKPFASRRGGSAGRRPAPSAPRNRCLRCTCDLGELFVALGRGLRQREQAGIVEHVNQSVGDQIRPQPWPKRCSEPLFQTSLPFRSRQTNCLSFSRTP